MHQEIKKKDLKYGLARMLSGFSWEWKYKKELTIDFELKIVPRKGTGTELPIHDNLNKKDSDNSN